MDQHRHWSERVFGSAFDGQLKEIGVPAQRISDIVAGKRAITADTDLRLCRFFGLSNGYWLRAQAAYDTEVAEEALAGTLAKITPWRELQLHLRQTV
jgi:plasmid maintenance system antidote protein VapI